MSDNLTPRTDAIVFDCEISHENYKASYLKLVEHARQLERELAEARKDSEPSAAARDVIAERKGQREREGYSDAHDDEHKQGEIAMAAACYATPFRVRNTVVRALTSEDSFTISMKLWPWGVEWWKPSPKNRRRELVKAGALILAEIERLDRAAIDAAKEGK